MKTMILSLPLAALLASCGSVDNASLSDNIDAIANVDDLSQNVLRRPGSRVQTLYTCSADHRLRRFGEAANVVIREVAQFGAFDYEVEINRRVPNSRRYTNTVRNAIGNSTFGGLNLQMVDSNSSVRRPVTTGENINITDDRRGGGATGTMTFKPHGGNMFSYTLTCTKVDNGRGGGRGRR